MPLDTQHVFSAMLNLISRENLMDYHYALQIASTGETIISETTSLPALRWQRKVEKRLLKNGARCARIKAAIRSGDTIVAWLDADALKASTTPEELRRHSRHVWRGMKG